MTTTTFGYRNHDATVAYRLAHRRQVIAEGLFEPRARARGRIYRRRFARSFGAVGGILGLCITLLEAGTSALASSYDETVTAALFCLALLMVPVAYALGRVLAPWFERRALRRAYAGNDDPVAALEALRHATGETITAQVAQRWELASLSLPLVAAALLGPLTLHAPFFLGATRPAHEFGQWILLSAMIVGHAHLAFAHFAHRYARKLTSGQPLGTEPALKTWGKTILVSAIPGILLMGIPPIITAVTGIFVVAPMFYWVRRTFQRERALLA